MFKLVIDPQKELGHINPELQGHFSEHLGRCIYGGVFVGEDSTIPNINGIRNDVVSALKDISQEYSLVSVLFSYLSEHFFECFKVSVNV